MNNCYICYEDKRQFKQLDCSHELCYDCYYKINNTCPFCRSSFIRILTNKTEKIKKLPYINIDNVKYKIRNRRSNIPYHEFLLIRRKRKINYKSNRT